MRAPEKLESGNAEAGFTLSRHGTGLEGLFACVVLILLLLGSLTPFSFAPDALRRIADGLVWRLGTPHSNPDDIITNFVVYLPVGATLYLFLHRRLHMIGSAGLGVLLASATSYLIEATQTLMPGRYASWTDVSVNCIGAGAGVVLAIGMTPTLRRPAQTLLRLLQERPLTALSGTLTLILCINSLTPFDFLLNPAKLEESFVAAGRSLIAVFLGNGSPSPASHAPLFTAHFVQAAGCFGILGFLMFAGILERLPTSPSDHDKSDHMRSLSRDGKLRSLNGRLITAIGRVWLVALMIESMQMVSSLHRFEPIDLLTNGIAATLGAIIGFVACKGRSGRRSVAIPIALPVAIWFVIAASIFIAPMGGVRLPLEISFNAVPMVDYFHLPLGKAVGEMAEVVTLYLMLTMLTVSITRRVLPETWRVASMGAVIAVAASGDLVEAVNPGGHLSGSNTILAGLAAFVVVRLTVLVTNPNLDQNKVRC